MKRLDSVTAGSVLSAKTRFRRTASRFSTGFGTSNNCADFPHASAASLFFFRTTGMCLKVGKKWCKAPIAHGRGSVVVSGPVGKQQERTKIVTYVLCLTDGYGAPARCCSASRGFLARRRYSGGLPSLFLRACTFYSPRHGDLRAGNQCR